MLSTRAILSAWKLVFNFLMPFCQESVGDMGNEVNRMPAYLTTLSETPVGGRVSCVDKHCHRRAVLCHFHAVLCALSPPVTSSAVPVTMRASSDARYT